MPAVQPVPADGERALAHQGRLSVDFAGFQQRQQSEGFEARSGMRHPPRRHFRMVGRQHPAGRHLEHHRRARFPRHGPRHRALQVLPALLRRCRPSRHQIDNDPAGPASHQPRQQHGTIVTARAAVDPRRVALASGSVIARLNARIAGSPPCVAQRISAALVCSLARTFSNSVQRLRSASLN